MTGAIAGAIVGAIAVVVITSMVCWSVWERGTHRRLLDVLRRIAPDSVDEQATIDESLARIERAVREISEHRRVIDTEDARLRAAFDGVPHAVMIFAEDGSLLDANATAEPVVRARHGDALVGAALSELVHDALVDGSARTSLELFGPPRRIVDISAVRLDGEAGGVVATVEDVTERHHLEEVRADLVANISHELKTPVGAIGLLAEMLEGEADPQVLARLVSRITGESMRLASIVDDLLDLSRIEAGVDVDGEDVVVARVVEDAIERVGSSAHRAGVELVVHDVDEHIRVVGDRSQLVSALSNLIDNAIKYSDQGSVVDVAVTSDASGVSLSVADEGMGIPIRDLDRIFERFYRVDQARSRDTGGSGLGLSIVRNVMRNHHGRVDVRSRLGEGSTFTMVVPTTMSEEPRDG